MEAKRKIIIVLLLISVCIIPFVFLSLQFFAVIIINGDGDEEDYTPSTVYNIVSPTLESISPNPSTDGNIALYWDDAEVLNPDLSLELGHYRVLRRKDGGSWKQIKLVFYIEHYYDYGLADGTYEYKIQTAFYKPIEIHYSDYSNTESVIVGRLPSNPSITINDGAETTNSLTVTLTLSCDNADEMQFRLSYDTLLNWTAYSTTYIITLFENDPDAPPHRIGVIFRNDGGTTEDAGYDDIYDDIIYDPEGDGDDNGDGDGEPVPPEPTDYTLLYVLLGVLVGLVGIVVFMRYRKQIIKSK